MMHVRNGILVLQYTVCIQCTVCKFPPEIPAWPGSFAEDVGNRARCIP